MYGRWVTLLLLALALAGCSQREPWRQESFVFGTRVELLIVGAEPSAAAAAGGEVLREFDRLHRSYHAWQDSELTALNQAIAEGRATEVSAELAQLLQEAQQLARAGDHLFDPGIGALVALWGFHSDELPSAPPAPEAIKRLLGQKPSIAQLRLDGRKVASRSRAVALDFGGYLKGYALDRAAAILRARGIRNALINIGGNVMALGSKEGRPWRIGIQHPRPEAAGGAPLATLDLHDGEAIGTSGDYQRFFVHQGKRYFHLLDPRSGEPAYGSAALTVLMPPGEAAGARSDAWSKPLFVAGKDWAALAKRMGLAAVLKVGADGTGPGTVVELTPAMKARLSVEAPDVRLVVRS